MNRRFLRKYATLFTVGALGYAAIETIWRGRTHWSMAIAGGICFIMFSVVADRLRRKNILIKAAVCALGVTLIELAFGLVLNVWLRMNVWDYSRMPLNLLGQICPSFTLMWAGLAILCLPLADLINRRYI